MSELNKNPHEVIEEVREEFEKRLERQEKEIERLKEQNRSLKQNLESEHVNKSSQDNEDELSRRGFLKKLGAGAAGLGALSLTPAASQLKITKNGISTNSGLSFGDSNVKLATLDSEHGQVYFSNNTSDPSSPKDGAMWRRSDQNSLKLRASGVTMSLVGSPSGAYQIQKDGTDGTGVINFKTT